MVPCACNPASQFVIYSLFDDFQRNSHIMCVSLAPRVTAYVHIYYDIHSFITILFSLFLHHPYNKCKPPQSARFFIYLYVCAFRDKTCTTRLLGYLALTYLLTHCTPLPHVHTLYVCHSVIFLSSIVCMSQCDNYFSPPCRPIDWSHW